MHYDTFQVKIDTSELLEKIECGDIECEILEFCEDVKEGD